MSYSGCVPVSRGTQLRYKRTAPPSSGCSQSELGGADLRSDDFFKDMLECKVFGNTLLTWDVFLVCLEKLKLLGIIDRENFMTRLHSEAELG